MCAYGLFHYYIYILIYHSFKILFSVLNCWFGDRKGIQPVKKLAVGLLVVTIWLELCTSCSSSCHHHLHHLGSNKIQDSDISGSGCPRSTWKNGRQNGERKRYIYIIILKLCIVLLYWIWCLCCCQGPFATFKMQQDKDCDWTGLKFSPDGKLILISTNGQVIRLIDAFQGTPLQSFTVNTFVIILYNVECYTGFDIVQIAINAIVTVQSGYVFCFRSIYGLICPVQALWLEE